MKLGGSGPQMVSIFHLHLHLKKKKTEKKRKKKAPWLYERERLLLLP